MPLRPNGSGLRTFPYDSQYIRQDPQAVLLLILLLLFWAGNIVVARETTTLIPPLALSLWRWMTAFILVSPSSRTPPDHPVSGALSSPFFPSAPCLVLAKNRLN